MYSTKLVLRHTDPIVGVNSGDKNGALRALADYFAGINAGTKRANYLTGYVNSAAETRAFATVTISSGSGDEVVTVNGVDITTAFDTDDATTSAAIVTDINAETDTLVANHVEACSLSCTVALASVLTGATVVVAGYPFYSTDSAPENDSQFLVGVADDDDGAALAAAINAREGLNKLVYAANSSGTVTISQLSGTTAAGPMGVSHDTLTLSGQLAATTTIRITAIEPGINGNCITLAASGTGMTASAARLAGGTGGQASPTTFSL